MEPFEALLQAHKSAVERFVYFRLPSTTEAEDLFQDICLTAYQNFSMLKDQSAFKAWIISIARNKCNDYFRKQAKMLEIPLDAISEKVLSYGRQGVAETSTVCETLDLLDSRDRQILYLYYFRSLPQSEIANRLQIPIGTVKSRLHNAKQRFKDKYPYSPARKGEMIMNKLPEYLPVYSIKPSDKQPFAVKWEELMGWFLIPKCGEKLTWGIYDLPSRKCDRIYDMRVTGRAEIHGIEGVELTARESDYTKKSEIVDRTFVAQLTDTHCRYLAEMQTKNGIKKYVTFLDGDAFMPNWGFGEHNCGNETNLKRKGEILRTGQQIKSVDKPFLLDIVGRCDVTINNQTYDTVCVMDIETYNPGIVSEQYLDQNGRTILWRRFNRDDWAFDRYQKTWSEQLPNNERLTINGKTYVHWYDCITDYIL